MKIRKAVVAAAGLGTRFLPQTKAMPKEMLPLIDKPIIQYIVEELAEAGVKDIIIVTGYQKRAIEDHFDLPNSELTRQLQAGDESKQELLKQLEKIANLANFIYIRQKGPTSNATPVLNAEHLIGNEPFIYAFGDDFIRAEPGRFSQMVKLYEERGSSVLSCVKKDRDEDYDRYGYAGGEPISDGVLKIKSIIEKPGKANKPSDLATVSSYIFTPEIFDYIRKSQESYDGKKEFYIQDAMQLMINEGKELLACEIKNGKYYDSGNKLEYLKTVFDFALKDKSVGQEIRDYMSESLNG